MRFTQDVLHSVAALLALSAGALTVLTPQAALAAPLRSNYQIVDTSRVPLTVPHRGRVGKGRATNRTSRTYHASQHQGSQVQDGVMTPKQEMLYLINGERAEVGSPPLRFDAALNAIAQERSQDMIDHHYFSHVIPDKTGGEDVFDVLIARNIPYAMGAENLAMNTYLASNSMDKTIQLTNIDLVNSPMHCGNILQPLFTKIGLGIAIEKGTHKLILTELFTRPPGN